MLKGEIKFCYCYRERGFIRHLTDMLISTTRGRCITATGGRSPNRRPAFCDWLWALGEAALFHPPLLSRHLNSFGVSLFLLHRNMTRFFQYIWKFLFHLQCCGSSLSPPVGSQRRNWEIQIRSLQLFSEVRKAFFLCFYVCFLLSPQKDSCVSN